MMMPLVTTGTTVSDMVAEAERRLALAECRRGEAESSLADAIAFEERVKSDLAYWQSVEARTS